MGRKKQEPMTRYRLTVPDADESVLEWLELQSHLSISLRLLIKEDIIRHGMQDVMNRDLELMPVDHSPRGAARTRRKKVDVQDEIPEVAEPVKEEPPVEVQKPVVKKQVDTPKVVAEPVPVETPVEVSPAVPVGNVMSMLSGPSKKADNKKVNSLAASMGLFLDDEE